MIPVQFPAGITKYSSKNAKIVNWRECHLMRWDSGVTMRAVGGWERVNYAAFTSPVRKMHKWVANDGTNYIAYLCETKAYVAAEGGALVDITPAGGFAPLPSNNAGYGAYKYSALKYGVHRPGMSKMLFKTPIFSMDNWGQELRVMTSADGRYLKWSPATPGTPLTAVTGAPTGNRSFIITSERHAMLFGMNSDNIFGWSNEQDDTNWAFTDITSKARFYELYPKSPITTQQAFDGGILIFTPAMSYLAEWIGMPYIYANKPIGRVSIPYSPASVCDTPLGVVWPSIDGWWIYDGTSVRVVPCDIWDHITETINVDQAYFSAACVHVANKGEVWWFYPPGRVAIWDYRNRIWSMGKLTRTCGFVYANDDNPQMSDGVNIWKHESGVFYPGTELPWIESMNLNPNGGENWFTLSKILPDVAGDPDALRWRMAKTNDRNGYTPETYSPQRAKNGSGYVDIRETARDMRLRIDMVKNANWSTVGPILFDSKTRGKK